MSASESLSGQDGKSTQARLAQGTLPSHGPRIHALTLSNPLPAGPPVAQDKGAEADDHHQYQNHPEKHRSWNTEVPCILTLTSW